MCFAKPANELEALGLGFTICLTKQAVTTHEPYTTCGTMLDTQPVAKQYMHIETMWPSDFQNRKPNHHQGPKQTVPGTCSRPTVQGKMITIRKFYEIARPRSQTEVLRNHASAMTDKSLMKARAFIILAATRQAAPRQQGPLSPSRSGLHRRLKQRPAAPSPAVRRKRERVA